MTPAERRYVLPLVSSLFAVDTEYRPNLHTPQLCLHARRCVVRLWNARWAAVIVTAMRLYTEEEYDQWLRERERLKPDETPGLKRERLVYPPGAYRFFYIAL